ncbi:trimeric intracellular cation channel family protein [Arthrobacter sp. zg-Y820]|uniref:trimeric intracellular cation channel family protein n=1 Tax=unclassified Arthrobacter TaxID=235627 RepID=UPI0025412F21|nr:MULTISPECIES: trimeric intracellular cation channel family protein [unclassified Arthrobacter]MCC9197109.1 trimeric intracellular cation channel family protein [Arthrobacter sp. zg-Y820]MDK1279974.1 trimeric intracellular cation channel family protein [Arthrobacter sp. zg.Y820]WIB09273.1 trimeric intracellular cation channel family protein [Arthrobacter sp. zg-Y820]
MENFDPGAVFDVVDLAGVLANGVLGGAVARQLRMDPIGFLVLALTSALGGGVLRDTLLQVGTPVALTNPAYLIVAIAGAFIAYLIELRGKWANRFLIVIDAFALGCWAATGTSKALAVDLEWLPAILIGMATAVGGGMIRDIVVGRVPAIFGGNTLYATGALIASVEMVILYHLGLPNLGMGMAIVTAAVVCTVARRRGWRLPAPGEWSVRLTRRPRGAGSVVGDLPGEAAGRRGGRKKEQGWPRPRFNRVPGLRSFRRKRPEADGEAPPVRR